MRVWNLILRSIAKRCVSKDAAIAVEKENPAQQGGR
jgi:hypothetical protein